MESYPLYFLARFALFIFRVLPRAIGSRLVSLLSTFIYFVDARHRRIAAVNLKIAFPELGKKQRSRIARKSYRNIGMNLLELSRLQSLTPENIASLVAYDPDRGLANYRQAASKGKGILYLTGHFSSWELLPTAHALYGYPLSFLTRPLDNPLLDKYLQKIRESRGNRVITKKNSARAVLKTLSSGGAVGILMDQNTSPQEGLFADMFGVPAATTSSIALFALRTDAPVLPGYLTPMRDGKYTIRFLPPIDAVRTGDTNRDLEINTRRFNEILEGIIREQPESWLWGHKRWKYQPPHNPPDLYALSDSDLANFLKQTGRKTE